MIQHGAILEVLVCQEALVVAKAIVPGAGAYLQRENLHTVLHQSLVQDLDLAASWGLHVRNLMACGTLAPATLLVVEMDELRFKSWITCELSAIAAGKDDLERGCDHHKLGSRSRSRSPVASPPRHRRRSRSRSIRSLSQPRSE